LVSCLEELLIVSILKVLEHEWLHHLPDTLLAPLQHQWVQLAPCNLAIVALLFFLIILPLGWWSLSHFSSSPSSPLSIPSPSLSAN
jgi:hypothetical protein